MRRPLKDPALLSFLISRWMTRASPIGIMSADSQAQVAIASGDVSTHHGPRPTLLPDRNQDQTRRWRETRLGAGFTIFSPALCSMSAQHLYEGNPYAPPHLSDARHADRRDAKSL